MADIRSSESADPSRPLARRPLWTLLVAGLCVLWLALLSLGPHDAATRVAAGPTSIIAPGLELALQAEGSSQPWGLVVNCQDAAQCSGLTLRTGKDAAAILPAWSDGARIGFEPIAAGSARLANTSSQPAAVRELWWYNASVHNAGFPRFALLYGPPAQREVNWFLAALLALSTVWLLWSAPGPGKPGRGLAWALALIVPPGLGLAAAGVARVWGLHLVLAWDAILLLAALGPLALRTAPTLHAMGELAKQPRAWYAKRLSPAAALVLLVLACLAVVLLVDWPPAKVPFDPSRMHRLKAAQPDYVILGNSMAGSRIDTALLSRLAGGAKVFDLHRNQSYSTIWYLLLKNSLVASGIKPRAVFLFFRDSRITNPWQGAAARRYRSMRERYSHGREPLVERITHERSVLYSQLHDATEPLYRLAKHQRGLRRSISQAAMDMARPVAGLTGVAMHSQRRVWEREVNQRFRLSRLRAATMGFRARAWKPNLDFEQTLHNSFLPAMIDLAKEHGFELVLIRVKTRQAASGNRDESKAMAAYAAGLAAYLRSRSVGFYDFTQDPAVTQDMFGNRDHIDRKHRKRYTRLFYQRLRSYFPPAN